MIVNMIIKGAHNKLKKKKKTETKEISVQKEI